VSLTTVSTGPPEPPARRTRKYSIGGHQPRVAASRLRHEHAVEWITMVQGRRSGRDRILAVDVDDPDSTLLDLVPE